MAAAIKILIEKEKEKWKRRAARWEKIGEKMKAKQGADLPRLKEAEGEVWMLSISLYEGPKTAAELEKDFYGVIRRFGYFAEFWSGHTRHSTDKLSQRIQAGLEFMVKEGLAEKQGKRYALTEKGKAYGEKARGEAHRTMRILRLLVRPQIVSLITLIVHLVLSALKLVAGLLSHSVALINDTVDTFLDSISSLLVYVGMRTQRELTARVIMLALFTAAGLFTLFHAVDRLLTPVDPAVVFLALFASIVSSILFLALWLYQRFAGQRSGSVALLMQSAGSRTHLILSLTVLVGLILTMFGIPVVDALVGLVISALILKNAVDLALEMGDRELDEESDRTRYRFGLFDRYRRQQLQDWMLYSVRQQPGLTRVQLLAEVQGALDLRGHGVLKDFGLNQKVEMDDLVTQAAEEIRKQGWVTDRNGLQLTISGEARLDRWNRHVLRQKWREIARSGRQTARNAGRRSRGGK